MAYPGRIYRIVGGDKVYYGSTKKQLHRRWEIHVAFYKNNYERKDGYSSNCRSKSLFEEFGIENCKIELVEEYPCNSREELEKRESFYIRNNDCVNIVIPDRTRAEYMRDTAEHQKEMWKKYYNNTIEKMKAKITCQVCGSIYNERQRPRHERSKKHTACL
jgi:hypothetical protein